MLNEKEFAERLIKVLEKESTCHSCPDEECNRYITQDQDVLNSCEVFLNYEYESKSVIDNILKCPCYRFGKEEAVKIGWLRLEELDYI